MGDSATGGKEPLYHALRSATGRNRWQRFWLVGAVFGAFPFATGCHWLRPLGSIKMTCSETPSGSSVVRTRCRFQSTELEEVSMGIVVALDVHRKQITYKTLDRETGEVKRGRIVPATRGAVREWLEQFAGCEVEFALEGTTGWRFVVEEIE